MKPFKPLLSILLASAALASLVHPCPAQRRKREPNLVLDASAAPINAVIARPIDRTEPVHETILDTPVCGIGRTIGSVHAELVPDPHRAVVDVILRGTVYSRTVGTRNTILIHTCSEAPMEIRRRVVIDGKGVLLFAGPSWAVPSTQLIDVTSTMDMNYLAICLTRRGFEGSRCAAEAESACKTVWRAGQRLEDELTPPLSSASAALGRQIAGFKRAGLSLEKLEFSTSASAVQGRARFSTPGRAEPIPVSLPPDFDLAVRVHESVANEAAQTEFGGRSFPLTGVSGIYGELTRRPDPRRPQEGRPGGDAEGHGKAARRSFGQAGNDQSA